MSADEYILGLEALEIGYNAGKKDEKVLMPPLNLSVRRGELVSLLGANGTGKSTLLRTISGLQEAVRGKIILSGRGLESYIKSELARKISFVFTGNLSVYNMTVFEIVSLGRFPHTNWLGKLRSADRSMVEHSIHSVGLMKYSSANIGELSDGERQRAMIARALAQDTELMLLDEPTAFLDLPNRYELVTLLRKLTMDNNKTVIFSSHDIHIALREADSVWIAGSSGIEQGGPEDLAISGSFNNLFSESDLRFVADEGTFTYPVRTRMTIKLEGSGLLRYWTERALNRLGIMAKHDAVSPSVTIRSADGVNTWVYESVVDRREFDDIYSLILYMKTILRGEN